MGQSIPVQKNQCYEITIDAVGSNGEGIGRIEGFLVFVKGGAVKDRLRIKIVKVNKSYAYGKIEQILSASPDRCQAACPAYARCGGCNLMHISYPRQLEIKRQLVSDALIRIGGLDCVQVEPVIGLENPFHFRNKSQFPVSENRENQPVTGFYYPRSHNLIAVDSCLVASESCKAVTDTVKAYMRRFAVRAYDETQRSGLIRHVFVRTATTGSVMAVIVTNGDALPHADELVAMLRASVVQLSSVILNCNREDTNLILGSRNVTLWGEDKLCDVLGKYRFYISPHSFYQVNPQQTLKLYQTAVALAGLTGRQTVFDLYCGIGTISIFLAENAKKVIGVELIEQAIEDAKTNAAVNGIDNVHFYAGDVGKVISRLYARGERADVVVVDPPRKGLDSKAIEMILQMQPMRIVYVSCNPATLARDLQKLVSGGYLLRTVQPVDMFCHTTHVETIVMLQRRDT